MSEHKMPAPVAWVAADTLNSPHPTCISSLAYMSQLDRERGREYVPLYAAPAAATVAREIHAAMTKLIKFGNRIEQRYRGVVWGDDAAVAQDWAEFRAALARAQAVLSSNGDAMKEQGR